MMIRVILGNLDLAVEPFFWRATRKTSQQCYDFCFNLDWFLVTHHSSPYSTTVERKQQSLGDVTRLPNNAIRRPHPGDRLAYRRGADARDDRGRSRFRRRHSGRAARSISAAVR